MADNESDPMDDTAAQDVARREAEVALRERRLAAREELARRGLGAGLLDHLDLGSEEALRAGLRLASLAAASPAPVPRESTPQSPAPATYRDRARLYREDPQAYRTMTQQERGRE
ncbi:MAG TPA: hypothetical protein VLA21_07430 [Candidatus Limnocylindria bacterium]|nr:hypothetical protein [Candidatus Limnocylindria bacterium]